MNLLPIADLIENAGLGIQGKTIFINQIPIEAPNGVLLRNKLHGTQIDYELPGFYKTAYQLIVRSTSYVSGEQVIDDVVSALTLNESQVGKYFFHYMRPATMPVVFPISKGNLLEFACDMEVCFVS